MPCSATTPGVLVSQLRPVADALTAADTPYSVLSWLYYNPAARLLADLAVHDTEITHRLLDGLPPRHQRILRPFCRMQVIRDARRRAADQVDHSEPAR